MHPGIAPVIGGRGLAALIDPDLGTVFSNQTSGTAENVFDGITNQQRTDAASKSSTAANSMYVGKTWGGGQKVAAQSARVYGSNDQGYVNAGNPTVTLTLYGKNGTAPAFGTNGTALGSVTFSDTGNESGNPRDIASSDPNSYWDHVWINLTQPNNAGVYIAEIQFTGWVS